MSTDGRKISFELWFTRHINYYIFGILILVILLHFENLMVIFNKILLNFPTFQKFKAKSHQSKHLHTPKSISIYSIHTPTITYQNDIDEYFYKTFPYDNFCRILCTFLCPNILNYLNYSIYKKISKLFHVNELEMRHPIRVSIGKKNIENKHGIYLA